MNGWISVVERLPTPDIDVPLLLWELGANRAVLGCYGEEWMDAQTRSVGVVTHWRPLPDGPAGEASR